MSLPRYADYKDSGERWLGRVPSHWQVHRLKTLFDIRKRIVGEDGHQVLSITQRGIKVRDTDSNDGQLSMDYSKYQIVRPGEFAMNHMDLLTGFVDISQFAGVTSPDYRVFGVRADVECEPRFFLYLFQNGYRQKIFYAFGQGASGFGRWRFPTDQFNDFRLPLPPLAEQAAIAAFLDRETAKIDALIAEQEKLIAVLAEKRQATISHAVTKGLIPDAPMKDSGVPWLGEVPAHWEIMRLRNVVTNSNAGEVIDRSYWGGDAERLYTCAVEPLPCDYKGFPESKRTKPNDLLLTRNGTPYVHEPIADSIYTNVVQRITLIDAVHRHFMAVTLQNSADNLRGYGVSIESLNYEMWKSLPFALPPMSEQELIADFVDAEEQRSRSLGEQAMHAVTLLKERRSALVAA